MHTWFGNKTTARQSIEEENFLPLRVLAKKSNQITPLQVVLHLQTRTRLYYFSLHSLMNFSEYYPDYFTATILEWKHLLKPDKYKVIIVSGLEFLVKEKKLLCNNPVAVGLCDNAENYPYSSAGSYKKANDNWSFLTHYNV